MNNRVKVIFGVILFFLITLYVIFGLRYTEKQSLLNFNTFDKSDINGRITWKGIRNKADAIMINNQPDYYIFKSTNSENYKYSFLNQAQVGDSVFKSAYSDTILLIDNDVIYKYTFQKGVKS